MTISSQSFSRDAGAEILAAAIARRYYLDRETKQEIAASLGISRFKVARMLDFAIEHRIVRFEIATPSAVDGALSEELRKATGLRRVVVVRTVDGDDVASMRRELGIVAARVLEDLVSERDILGIGWGRTLSAMAGEIKTMPKCVVVQMGGIVGNLDENSLEVVRRISAAGGGTAYPIYAPLVLTDAESAESLRAQPGAAAAIALYPSITIGAVSIGSWSPRDSQLLSSLDRDEVDRYLRDGVRAEVLSTLIRDDGSVLTGFQERSLSMDIDGLRGIPELVLVAGGVQKTLAVRAVLRAGLGATLITDHTLAEAYLALT